MPPKTKFTKEDIVKAAINVVEINGIRSLTARRIAKELGSSTGPVYQHFTNMDEINLAVIKATEKMLLEYSREAYTDRVFLNMGTGIALFACEHSELYHALMLERDDYSEVVNEFLEVLESELSKDSRLTILTPDERHVLLVKMWTFTHGLASQICVGLIKNCNKKYIIETLLDIGADVIGSTLAKHKNNNKT
jgi:AcrR family transcriptional regulator